MMLAALLVLAFLPGCGEITIGPRTRTDIVFVRNHGIAARVAENKRVMLTVTDDEGHVYQKVMDIGGFFVMSPDEVDDAESDAAPSGAKERERNANAF